MVPPLKFGMDKHFNPSLNNRCNYLSMLAFKLNRVSKRGPDQEAVSDVDAYLCLLYDTDSTSSLLIQSPIHVTDEYAY